MNNLDWLYTVRFLHACLLTYTFCMYSAKLREILDNLKPKCLSIISSSFHLAKINYMAKLGWSQIVIINIGFSVYENKMVLFLLYLGNRLLVVVVPVVWWVLTWYLCLQRWLSNNHFVSRQHSRGIENTMLSADKKKIFKMASRVTCVSNRWCWSGTEVIACRAI